MRSEAATWIVSPGWRMIRSRTAREGSDSTPAVTTEVIDPSSTINWMTTPMSPTSSGVRTETPASTSCWRTVNELGPVPRGEAIAAGTPIAAAALSVVKPPPGRELAASAWTEPPLPGMYAMCIGSTRATE